MSNENVAIVQVPPYVRVQDVERYFGIKERRVWWLLKKKMIIGSKHGANSRLWNVKTKSIFKYLKKHEIAKEA